MKIVPFLAIGAALVIAAIISWQLLQPFDEESTVSTATQTPTTGPSPSSRPAFASMPTQQSPQVTPSAKPTKREAGTDQIVDMDIGKIPFVRADQHPQLALAAEAIATGKHPERVSSFHEPTPFRDDMTKEELAIWIATPEPGRAFRPHAPGKDVPMLGLKGSNMLTVKQGESVTLQTKGVPGAPVTFSAFDNGVFANKCTAMTVVANDDGIATATFTVTTGVYGSCSIIAASPKSSAQVRFNVEVIVPTTTSSSTASTIRTKELSHE